MKDNNLKRYFGILPRKRAEEDRKRIRKMREEISKEEDERLKEYMDCRVTSAASEKSLSKNWSTKEENKVWKHPSKK